MKTRQRILSLILAVMMLVTVLIVPTSASAQPVSTLNEDYLGPVTSKDVIYQIITDRFYDGDTSNNVPSGFDPSLFDGTGTDIRMYQGGDWQGIIDKIPYLQSMGITAVWISAPYENRDTVTDDG